MRALLVKENLFFLWKLVSRSGNRGKPLVSRRSLPRGVAMFAMCAATERLEVVTKYVTSMELILLSSYLTKNKTGGS